MRHRWEITLREFAEKARRDRGIEVDITKTADFLGLFFRKGDKIYAHPGLEDVVLTPTVLRSLCTLYGLPPLDFGLDPDEEDP